MKKIAILCALMFIFVACQNEEHKTSYKQASRYEQNSSNSLGIPKQTLNEGFSRIEPPKPQTKGALDFSECKEKYGTGTEYFKACVKAKNPNIKFAE